MRLLYDISLRLFVFAANLAALFNPKARLWVQGRKDWRKRCAAMPFLANRSAKVLWVHAASLGEFEQGRPVIEAFRAKFPDWKIVLTFFSPSGYEVRKHYPHADLICYLPADTRRNAADFIELIQPDKVIFIKYEFWANYLFELKKRGITTLLVSALFRPSQSFFKPYGSLWRKMLTCFTHIFVQNMSSGNLLQSIGIQHVTVAGDTRVDRVLSLAEVAPGNAVVESFLNTKPNQAQSPVLVVGSSWEPDETVIFKALQIAQTSWKCIIAPHETSETNVARIGRQAGNSVRYSQWKDSNVSEETRPANLIIDNIGMLNSLYQYGTVAYIGGGFGKGIHNTLEPTAFGLPVIFGPKYEKFEEARQFVARGGAFVVQNPEELALVLMRLQEPVFYQKASDAVRSYLEESRGATAKVMAFLESGL